MNIVRARIDEVVRILNNFAEERDGVHSRKEYVQLLKNDLSFYFGYTMFLLDRFIQLFPPSEVRVKCHSLKLRLTNEFAQLLEFLEANEQPRPVTIRTNTLKTRRKDLAQALIGRGAGVGAIEWSQVGVQVFDSTVPIGMSQLELIDLFGCRLTRVNSRCDTRILGWPLHDSKRQFVHPRHGFGPAAQ